MAEFVQHYLAYINAFNLYDGPVRSTSQSKIHR